MRQLPDLAREHLGLAVAGVLTLMTLLRTLAIANYDPVTALAVLQERGLVDVVSATLLSIGYWVPLLVLYVGDVRLRREHEWKAVLLALVLGAFLWPFWVLVLFGVPLVIIEVVGFIGRLRDRDRSGRFYGEPRFRRSGIAALVVVALIPLLQPLPWMPAERLTIQGRQVTGYVLSDEGTRLSILRETDRAVVYLDAVDLTDRELCRGVGPVFNQPPLAALRTEQADYPDCPS